MAGDTSIALNELLPSSIDELGDQIREHMAEQGQIGRVAWAAASKAALDAIRDKLSFDLVEGLARTWAEAAELREYRDAEKHPRGRDEQYELGKNSVELEAEPQLVVSLGSWEAPPLSFGYTVCAHFNAVRLTIRDGAVRAAALGGCEVTGVLSLKGHRLHEPCRLAEGRLPGRLVFDPPVAIP